MKVDSRYPVGCVAVVFASLLGASGAWADCAMPFGDINGSGSADVIDAQCSIQATLAQLQGVSPSTVPCLAGVETGDPDCSGTWDVSDVGLVISAALELAVPPALDADGNGCPDSCDSLSPPLNIELAVVAMPNNTLGAIASISTSAPASVRVEYWSDDTALRVTAWTDAGTEHVVPVLWMRADSVYSMQVVAEDEDSGLQVISAITEHLTGSLPAETPTIAIDIAEPTLVQPGVTIFGATGNQVSSTAPLYLGVDEAGEVVWYYADATLNAGQGTREARDLGDGTMLLAVPGSYRVIDAFGDTALAFSGQPGASIHHDAVLTGPAEALVLSNEQITVDAPALGGVSTLTSDVIRAMDADGNIGWEWHAHEWLDTNRFPGPLSSTLGNGGAYDWTHANAITLDDAGATALISVRHQNWVIKIDLTTGEVLWKLGEEGDFALTAGEWFYSQHAPQILGDGLILLYDNGNERPTGPPTSRAVIYQIDEESMTAAQVWEYIAPVYTGSLGDANLLDNDNVLVCAGGVAGGGGGGGPPPARIVEVTSDPVPTVVWDLQVSGRVYRANRFPPVWPQ